MANAGNATLIGLRSTIADSALNVQTKKTNLTSYLMKTEHEFELDLRKEGFFTFLRSDPPNHSYPEHKHDQIAAHIIIKGEMWLTVEGKRHFLNQGDRFDVPKGVIHSAKIGPKGCTYLIGEK